MHKTTLFLASLGLALFVILDAMGAHALKSFLENSDLNRLYTAGTKYLMFASFSAILMTFAAHIYGLSTKVPLFLLLFGTFFFSINLLVLFFLKTQGIDFALSGILAPFGGLLFISAWVVFGLKALKTKKL